MRMRSVLWVLLALCAVSPAQAQQFDNQFMQDRRLLDRITKMETDLNSLQRQVYRGGSTGSSGSAAPVPAGNVAQVDARVSQMEEEMRRLNGRLEELEHQNNQLNKQIQQLGEQMILQSAKTPATDSAPSATDTTAKEELNLPTGSEVTLPKTSASDQYEHAFGLLRQSKFKEAETALKQFLTDYNSDPLASNAYYWLGETYYVQKNYEQAAIQFLKGYKNFPKGKKAPDSLLKLGMTLGHMNKTKEACATFSKIGKEFPDASNAIKQQVKQEADQQKCS